MFGITSFSSNSTSISNQNQPVKHLWVPGSPNSILEPMTLTFLQRLLSIPAEPFKIVQSTILCKTVGTLCNKNFIPHFLQSPKSMLARRVHYE